MIELETVVLTAVVVLLLHVFLRRYALADRLNGPPSSPSNPRFPPSSRAVPPNERHVTYGNSPLP